jgi:hypothetical protein
VDGLRLREQERLLPAVCGGSSLRWTSGLVELDRACRDVAVMEWSAGANDRVGRAEGKLHFEKDLFSSATSTLSIFRLRVSRMSGGPP